MIKSILFTICAILIFLEFIYISENMSTKFQILCFGGGLVFLLCLQIFFNKDVEK